MRYWYYLALVVICLIALYLLFEPSLNELTTVSDIFNNFAIGIAALLGIYLGNNYFRDEIERRRKIKEYGKKYPYNQYSKTWKIIVREDREGEPHVLDIKSSVIHHIWNMKTIFDLGWQFYSREPVKIETFDAYQRGEPIRTRGELGE